MKLTESRRDRFVIGITRCKKIRAAENIFELKKFEITPKIMVVCSSERLLGDVVIVMG